MKTKTKPGIVTDEALSVASGALCPDCGKNYLTPYQAEHRYQCDACRWETREADPIIGPSWLNNCDDTH